MYQNVKFKHLLIKNCHYKYSRRVRSGNLTTIVEKITFSRKTVMLYTGNMKKMLK